MKEYKVYVPFTADGEKNDRNKQRMESALNNFAQQGYKIVGIVPVNSSLNKLNIFLERDIPDEENPA